MLVLGFSELYSWWLMALIATATVGLGWPRISQICRAFSASCRETWRSAGFERFALMGTCLAAAGATGAVIVEKGLFPNGTGDYFSHYLPYFQYVIARGDIWPNEVWYHFFISKAAGDIVFAVLLTDLLGPQAVSCTMFFAALLIMFSFVRRATDDVLVGLAATTATAIAFIWTFETAVGFSHWAEFPKEHVTTATLFFGCVWASWRGGSVPGPQLKGWSVLVSIGYVGLVLLRVQFALLVILFLAMMAAWAWRSGKRDLAWSYMLPVASVAASAMALLCVNYAVMGVAEVTPFRFFWSFADQARFARWVSPFLMLLLDIGSSPNLGSFGRSPLLRFPPADAPSCGIPSRSCLSIHMALGFATCSGFGSGDLRAFKAKYHSALAHVFRWYNNVDNVSRGSGCLSLYQPDWIALSPLHVLHVSNHRGVTHVRGCASWGGASVARGDRPRS